ncbi:hypothetical protein H312_02076, partial [Anncaliia algerae PRA339]
KKKYFDFLKAFRFLNRIWHENKIFLTFDIAVSIRDCPAI